MTIPLWVRLSFWAALFLGGAWLAWHIEGWREGAAKAEQLQTDLDNVRALHTKSETARLTMAGAIAQSAAKVHAEVQEARSRVRRPTVVAGCVLDDDLTSTLNRARGYAK